MMIASLAALPAAGCEGIEDIPDSTVICCQTGDVIELRIRIDCVYNPEGRVVPYALCDDAGSDGGEDAASEDAGEDAR